MNRQTILVAIIALLIGGIGGYAITDKDESYEKSGERMSDNQMGMHQMPDGTMMGDTENGTGQMDHSMMMVKSDREFLTGMIPHHQEAVDTAKEVIARGGSTPEIKTLVENIVIAQEKEIAEMKQWYQDWYGLAYEAKPEDYQPMMRELANLSGAELDKRFLEDMVAHHMGAIMMAESVQPYIEHNEITELTQAIVTSQSAEITQMRQMLKGL
jgi:uncharacterized protein (DUF305 family)